VQPVNPNNKYYIELTINGQDCCIHGVYSEDTVNKVGQDNLPEEMKKNIEQDIERMFNALTKTK
jgi:hypothetical protein